MLSFHGLELVVIFYFKYFVWIIYSCSPSMALNLLTFFSLGILNVPCDSLVSISRLWISMSLFFTWYSSSNFSPNTTQDPSKRLLQRAARSSLLMADTSGRDPTFSSTASGTPILLAVRYDLCSISVFIHIICRLKCRWKANFRIEMVDMK